MKTKSTTPIIIPGDPVSQEEVVRRLDINRLNFLKFKREKIRTSDMDADRKRVAYSALAWRIRELENKVNERS
ncbi:MAG: hypothetical protein SPL08_00705 [Pseudomonadota bacterium]|nr:hypothetical protein [Pseudomonadota bacterium]